MKLKITKEQVIDSMDWDEFVTETYGRPYCFQQQDGCKDRGTFRLVVPECGYDEEDNPVCENPVYGHDFENDVVPEIVNHDEMGVSFKSWLKRDPKKLLLNQGDQDVFSRDLWWNRNFYPEVHMVANDLYEKGLLEEGEYLIII